jgi:hypothetical protein
MANWRASTMRTQPSPCELHERQRRHDGQFDDAGRGSLTQELDRPLAHRRRAGDGVEHLAVLVRSLDDPTRDLGVHVVDRLGRVVHIIERGRVLDERGRRMPLRAHETYRHMRDRFARRGGREFRSSGAEADDDDSAAGHGLEVGGASEPDEEDSLSTAGGVIL